MRPEDLVVAVDGTPITTVDDLQRLMTAERIDEPVRLDVVREGRLLALDAVPVELPT